MSHPTGSGTVLLADDDPAILKMTERVLQIVGYRSIAATDIGESLAALREHEIDLVLLDLHMPGMKGRPTIEEMRRLRPGLPIIIVTGRTEEETRKELGSEIDVGYLEKPFELPAMIAEVRRATGAA